MKLNVIRSLSNVRTLVTSVFLSSLIFLSSVAFSQDGEKLFKQNCAACHTPTEKAGVGPGLAGVQERWEGREELLYKWIKNPQAAIETGDSYIRNLMNEWEARGGIMAAQAVTDEQIDAILDYIANYVPPTPAGGPSGDGDVVMVEKESDPLPWLIVLSIVLIIVIFVVAGVRRSLDDAVRDKEGLPPAPELSTGECFKQWMWNNKVLTTFIIIFLIAGGMVDGWTRLSQIGVYEGYKPEQPIWFSHEVHAGKNEIDCQYCHSSAEKSKSAGIPSVNVCMNCHLAIDEGSITGTEEIAKIYKALDFDPETRTYGTNQTPIKWVKVHNLPDLSYFNHSQHVKVAGLECEECHGDVKSMDVAHQHSPLTMGWCINCHGDKTVSMEDNPYYQDIHSRMSNEHLKSLLEDGDISVKDLGGWECAKCHY
jgi:cytochrome c2